ncbi:transposase, partial [Vibrio parahaemolyticus]|nr:transposase [Vibrio parahaemolyticus]MBE4039777.1 transposase [Vibrio parahaemolyticus]
GVPSMSRQGNCWDNAVMESFYSRLKVELIYAEDYQTLEEARIHRGILQSQKKTLSVGVCQPG